MTKIVAERLLCYRPTFSMSLMVSAAVSKLSCTEVFFIKPELKVDGKYYCEVLLKKQMLPVIHGIAGNTFAFNKTVHLCSVHHTREIVQLLEQETLDFISPDLWPQTIRT